MCIIVLLLTSKTKYCDQLKENLLNYISSNLYTNFFCLGSSLFFLCTWYFSNHSSSLLQGCHFPDNMKLPDFSTPRLSSTMSPRPFRGSGGMLPPKIFKIRIFRLAQNEFQTTKFPDFSRFSRSVATLLLSYHAQLLPNEQCFGGYL